MTSELVFIIFAWLFFLICGGIMMVGVYLIFGKKKSPPQQRV